jgi:hypothetical protein
MGPPEQDAIRRRILDAFSRFARAALDWEERHIEMVVEGAFPHLGSLFAQTARRYDPNIAGGDIFQASRNAWTMNGLQRLLGLPMALTPSVFGYSMLYPYTDNYLDDPCISQKDKAAFNARFGRRIAGEPVEPHNDHERRIYDMIALIEIEFSRDEKPGVYESLLAIHDAQTLSVGLVQPDAAPYEIDVLGISIAKGGASVLADGYLVAGDLTATQAECLYGYGAFLQLADDLQDVQLDRRDGLMTVFSQTAGHWPLDSLCNKAYRFGQSVLARLEAVGAAEATPLKELMARSTLQLLLDAIGRNRRFVRRRYARELQAHYPFRFRTMRLVRRRLERERRAIMRMVEAFAAPRSDQPLPEWIEAVMP